MPDQIANPHGPEGHRKSPSAQTDGLNLGFLYLSTWLALEHTAVPTILRQTWRVAGHGSHVSRKLRDEC